MSLDMEKRDRFLRLNPGRTEKAVHAIKVVGNTASRKDYEFTPEEAEACLDQIESAVADLRSAFGLPARVEAGEVPVIEVAPPATEITGGPLLQVEGYDRRTIREALAALDQGDTRQGVKKLRGVVLGWVPEAWQEAAE